MNQSKKFDYPRINQPISNPMMSSKVKFGQQVKYTILVKVNNNNSIPNQSMTNGLASSKETHSIVKICGIL